MLKGRVTFDTVLFGAAWLSRVFLHGLLLCLRWITWRLSNARRSVLRAERRVWYRMVTDILADSDVLFLNYGYVGLDPGEKRPELREEDEGERYPIQLYHHLAGSIDLNGLDGLEVSSGHGGGASYVMRYLKPASMRGVDRNEKAIAFCKRRHAVEGLSFLEGEAERLPFADRSFDVVINVEASHCYPDMALFLKEVFRVLRPGGHFLFADMRGGAEQKEILERQFAESGLTTTRHKDITRNVLDALERDGERRVRLIESVTPRILKRMARKFAGTKGTTVYEAFRSGKMSYLSYVLQRRV